jgi:hypothetical protein
MRRDDRQMSVGHLSALIGTIPTRFIVTDKVLLNEHCLALQLDRQVLDQT